MDTQLIEKSYRRRYRMLLWATIGYAVIFGAMIAILNILNMNEFALLMLAIGQALYMTNFMRGLFAANKAKGMIARSPGMKEVANDELVRFYVLKSINWGFMSAMILAVIFLMAARLVPALTIETVCLSIIYAGTLTVMISQLVYLRR